MKMSKKCKKIETTKGANSNQNRSLTVNQRNILGKNYYCPRFELSKEDLDYIANVIANDPHFRKNVSSECAKKNLTDNDKEKIKLRLLDIAKANVAEEYNINAYEQLKKSRDRNSIKNNNSESIDNAARKTKEAFLSIIKENKDGDQIISAIDEYIASKVESNNALTEKFEKLEKRIKGKSTSEKKAPKIKKWACLAALAIVVITVCVVVPIVKNKSSDSGIPTTGNVAEQQLKYRQLADGTYEVVGMENTQAKSSLSIPESYNGVRVTSIGEYAFMDCIELTSVTIPKSVKSIGEGAFKGCSNLAEITLPFVGSGKTASGGFDQVFGYIFGYTTIRSGEDLPIPGVTGIYMTNNLDKIYGYYIPLSLKSVTITGGNIPEYAFFGCTQLTEIKISDNVTSIGGGAFWSCSGLNSINIPNKVQKIGQHMFSGCSSLKNITIPDSVTSIEYAAFENCTGLTSIVIPKSVVKIGERVFSGCNNLVEMAVPFVGVLGYDAVFGCLFDYSIVEKPGYTYQYTDGNDTNYYYNIPSSLKSVTITGGDVPHYAFYNCTGLTSIKMSDNVTSIGANAFYNCTGLTSITISDNVTSIGYNAFYNCIGLTSIKIPNKAMDISDSTFLGCVNLMSATMPTEAVSYIPKTNLRTAVITSGTSIGSAAFKNCTELTSITLPESITNIESSAFEGCKKLTSITIPSNVTSIGNRAFYGCSELTEITINDSIRVIGDNAFSYCSSLSDVYIDSAVVAAWNASNSGLLNNADYVYIKDGLNVGSYITSKFKKSNYKYEPGYVRYV